MRCDVAWFAADRSHWIRRRNCSPRTTEHSNTLTQIAQQAGDVLNSLNHIRPDTTCPFGLWLTRIHSTYMCQWALKKIAVIPDNMCYGLANTLVWCQCVCARVCRCARNHCCYVYMWSCMDGHILLRPRTNTAEKRCKSSSLRSYAYLRNMYRFHDMWNKWNHCMHMTPSNRAHTEASLGVCLAWRWCGFIKTTGSFTIFIMIILNVVWHGRSNATLWLRFSTHLCAYEKRWSDILCEHIARSTHEHTFTRMMVIAVKIWTLSVLWKIVTVAENEMKYHSSFRQ